MSLPSKQAPAGLCAQAIADTFGDCFLETYGTYCTGGASEPLYLPASPTAPARLTFRGDYAASALHEISHWCVAGKRRRSLVDFGYDYVNTPRTAVQQVQFLRAEVRPQALEWVFADSAGVRFNYSFDDVEDRFVVFRSGFRAAVNSVKARLQAQGLGSTVGPRAAQFHRALTQRQ